MNHDRITLVEKSQFKSFDDFRNWCKENQVSGNIYSQWFLLQQYGEISVIAEIES